MIKIICVGKVKDVNLRNLISEREERLSSFRMEIIEIKDSTPEKEAKDIESKIKNEKVYLFDERGKEFTSEDFTKFLQKEMTAEKNIAFVIGGPLGLYQDLKNKYPSIALSKMTYTHEQAKFLVMEQFYRAYTIMKGIPYHK